jgi:Mg-chelatase subunit ChlD
VGRGVRAAEWWGCRRYRRGRQRRPGGKSVGPDGALPRLKEGAAADAAIEQARRSTLPRRQLARHPRFEEVSPDVGVLDEEAFDDILAEDADEALGLIADMCKATDVALRDLARRLAGRLVVDVARRGPVRHRGVGRIASMPFSPDAGDLDLDASADAIVEAHAAGAAIDPERLRIRRWVQPRTAVCLLVDRSGSMVGRPLATSAVAAAAVAHRAGTDFSVVSFARDGIAVKSQDAVVPVERIVDAVLALRGRGSTDLAGALRLAALQLGRSNAGRKITVLLSDCRATEPGDVVGAAGALDELVIIAPTGDDEAAHALAAATGAAVATVAGPSGIPDAFTQVLG